MLGYQIHDNMSLWNWSGSFSSLGTGNEYIYWSRLLDILKMATPLSMEHGGALSSGNNPVLLGLLLTPEVAHGDYSNIQHEYRLHSA